MTLTTLTHQIRFPSDSGAELSQDQEWCEVLLDDEWTRIRFHDYGDIYSIPAKSGGKLRPRLNTGERPIANKYREGKMKRTLKRESKSA